jgi:uncharacterized protein (DUF2384 family)
VGTRPIAVTDQAEPQLQLERPSAEIIRSRANEVFGDANKARAWLRRPRRIFNNQSPENIIESGDRDMMREVLKSLIAIEFGTFS